MDSASLSVWSLILSASIVVKAILLLLLIGSIVSWALIIRKRQLLAEAKRELKQFETSFWSGQDLTQLYHQQTAKSGLSAVFQAGFKAFLRWHERGNDDNRAMLGDAERAMKVAFSRENDRLEENLTILATLGSVSPYIGLFGTVWGIMNAFVALGGVDQATLSMVAPGIAEALIATAMGLFVAIPAVIAYNRFTANIERVLNEYENFVDEFVSLLYRQTQR